ncbi:hypothetical protein [Ruminiclostridium josui]|uniref:hypothetical protein n=1 Tax=Ruminiclostridium josui TaxID=1499 RepID=UPI000A8C57C8|nr:hypothetical protein [Ruminiclostridium josui]
MKINMKIIRRFGAAILAGVLITSGNLQFCGYKSLAASQDTVETEETSLQDNDLKLFYNTMAGSNFSGNPYDNNESFYKALPWKRAYWCNGLRELS